MEVTQKFWNIFRCILNSIGTAVTDDPEGLRGLLVSFTNILLQLNYTPRVVILVLKFINFAWEAFQLIRGYINRSPSGGMLTQSCRRTQHS